MASSHSCVVAVARRPGSLTDRQTARRASETWPPCRQGVGAANAGAAAAIDARTSWRWGSGTSSRRGCGLVGRLGSRADPESAGVGVSFASLHIKSVVKWRWMESGSIDAPAGDSGCRNAPCPFLRCGHGRTSGRRGIWTRRRREGKARW